MPLLDTAGFFRIKEQGDPASFAASWILDLLAPVDPDPKSFDERLLDFLVITVCEPATNGGCNIVATLSASGSNVISLNNSFYTVYWNVPSDLIGKSVEIRVTVAGLQVGTFKQELTSGGTLPIKFRVDEQPRIRARVLHQQGVGAAGVGAVLAGEFNLGPLETLLVLSWEKYDAAELALALRDVFHLDASAAAKLLKSAGQNISNTATALRVAYGETPNSAALILNDAGYPCLEISAALTTSFGLRLPEALATIRGLGCVPNERCEYPPAPPASDDAVATANLIDFMATALHPLPPVGDEPRAFDKSLLDFLKISIFEVGDAGQRTLVAQFDTLGSTGNKMDIDLVNHFYMFTWKPEASQVGRNFEVRFLVAGLDLGFVSARPTSTDARPFHFRIDSNPVLRARVLKQLGLSAAAIAAQLRCEFALAADATVRLLYEEKFTPLDIGQALQSAYAATEVQAATALRLATLPATQTLRMLRQAFQQLERTNNVATLRMAGFGVQDVWRALEIVLSLGNEQIEDTLLAGGFIEDDVLEVLTPRLLAKYACLIEHSGPTVYLHPGETYRPSSVDWFMERANLVSSDGTQRFTNHVTPGKLMDTVAALKANNGATKFWFELSEADRVGDLDSAKAYVHAVRLKDIGMTDLQFWLFRPFNGPGTIKAKAKLFGSDLCEGEAVAGNVTPIGEHTGDWESVILRFDNATSKIVEVYTSQHGNYPRSLTWSSQTNNQDVHPIFYGSRNGHANYVTSGDNADEVFSACQDPFELRITLLNRGGKGLEYRIYEAYDFVGLDQRLIDARWMKFEGRWGPNYAFNLEGIPPGLLGTLGIDRGRKDEIVRAAAGSCITAVRVAIPIASLAGCAVVCAPASLLFGFGYFSCLGTCTAVSTAALELAVDPLIAKYAPEVVDSSFPDQTSDGPPSPGARTTEWVYFRFPAESSLISIEIPSMVGGTNRVSVNVLNQVCMKLHAACDKCKCDPQPASSVCSNMPPAARVELAIDGIYFDISANIATNDANGTTYFLDWDTTSSSDGPHELRARATGINGAIYEYPFGSRIEVANHSIVLNVDNTKSSIVEGEQLALSGDFKNPDANQYPVTINWGDGTTNTVLPTPPAPDGKWHFEAVHTYLDDDPSGTSRDTYTIPVTVGDNLARAIKQVIVENVPPTIGPIAVSTNIVPIGTPMTAMVGFTDPGILDTHTALFEWGDGQSNLLATVTSPVAAAHAYSTPGFYSLAATITDDDNGSSSSKYSYVVAYDPVPSGGSGVGQILAVLCDTNTSPQCTTNNASFAFVLNEDSGYFNARFETKGIYFDATNYTALTNVAGRITVSGTGNLNGFSTVTVDTNTAPFLYFIQAKDGLPSPDTFQLRISILVGTNLVGQVFDTGTNQPIVPGSGDIIIKP